MAAYAALVSLTHIIKHLQHHPRPPITLDQKHILSLTQNITFLQDFLESYPVTPKDALESRITDVAYAAAEIIESQVIRQILAELSANPSEENMASVDFWHRLDKVIQDMDLIKEDATGFQPDHGKSTPAGRSKSPPTIHKTMVGFDGIKFEVMDKLTRSHTDRQIIPISGMGGIGKTTLARNIYSDPLIRHHFDILAWVTISQEYRVKKVLLDVILCLKTITNTTDELNQMSEHKLGEMLYKSLVGRKYFIVMDDIWSIEAWEKVRFFFPDNNNGSRILVTTRLSDLASQFASTFGLEMNFLDEDKSWDLLRNTVFGEEEDCPVELEKVGKKIAEKCNGLPLSLVVIGGLLAKSNPTRKYWENVLGNLNAIVNSEENERCLRILHMSYDELPVHLKPCFLHMGMFLEGCEIRVPNLIKAWVAEGFLKPHSVKTSEVLAEEYLEDLIARNLVLARRRGPTGKLKLCAVHDLLRDLGEREAEKQDFLCARKGHNLSFFTIRRVAPYHLSPDVFDPMYSNSFVHAMVSEDVSQLVNTRYIAAQLNWISHPQIRGFPSSVYFLANLQTLIVLDKCRISSPFVIWNMAQIRHVQIDSFCLSTPFPPSQVDTVLENLQTLSTVNNLDLSKEVVNRIPKIKKMKLNFEGKEVSRLHLENLGYLRELESLSLRFPISSLVRQSELLPIPACLSHSLTKLSLESCYLDWEDMNTKIGSLPLLQVLKLRLCSFVGPLWETDEDQFQSLKFLLVEMCRDFECWKSESAHFPQLEHVVLRGLRELKEIPLGIEDVATLKYIDLDCCSDSAVISARCIVDEQEELGNVGLQVRVRLWKKNRELESLASDVFQVKIRDGYLNEE
ncbi:disease resistance protein [Striga asiatica]|uniref:Disease resistance protein n=1 Tax=Striga asiatica TaxID=4170 RepID=A0A5A7QT35_STRAF|nr:disease resistance protein [Striga asiatica]